MKKLIVTRYYQDVSGVKIRPETYEADDLRIAGMANWLVSEGYAEWEVLPEPAIEVIKPVAAKPKK